MTTNTDEISRLDNLWKTLCGDDQHLTKGSHFKLDDWIEVQSEILDIHPDDWKNIVDRGYTWEHFVTFIRARRCVCIGPLFISAIDFCLDPSLDECLTINKNIFIQEVRYHGTAEQLKATVLPILNLLSTTRDGSSCDAHRYSIVLDIVQDSDVHFQKLTLDRCDEVSPHQIMAILQKCDSLFIHGCSFTDQGTAFYEGLQSSATTIRKLSVYHCNLPTKQLAAALQSARTIEDIEFNISNVCSERQWDELIESLMDIRSLRAIKLRGFRSSERWLNCLLILFRSKYIRSIIYDVFFDYPVDDPHGAIERKRTLAILEALQQNDNVYKLSIPTIDLDQDIWKSDIVPLLTRRRAQCYALKMANLVAKDPNQTALLGCKLVRDGVANNANDVYEMLLQNCDQVLRQVRPK